MAHVQHGVSGDGPEVGDDIYMMHHDLYTGCHPLLTPVTRGWPSILIYRQIWQTIGWSCPKIGFVRLLPLRASFDRFCGRDRRSAKTPGHDGQIRGLFEFHLKLVVILPCLHVDSQYIATLYVVCLCL